MGENFTQDDLVNMAKDVLSFLRERVGGSYDLIDLVLTESKSQNHIGKRINVPMFSGDPIGNVLQ